MAEIRVVVARVVWAFELRLEDEVGDSWDWGDQRSFLFWEKRGLRVCVRERDD